MNSIKLPLAGLIKQFSTLYLPLILIASVIRVEASDFCNPVVTPVSSDTTLERTLTRIAEEYDFKLSFPPSLDRPVRLKKSMKLDQMVKFLTTDMNTVLKHKKVSSCATAVLTHLIVLPAGKLSGYASITQPAQENPPAVDQSEDYIYIDDMELYVSEVLKGKKTADVAHMTPEQREEFNATYNILSTQLGEQPTALEESTQVDINEAGQQ